MRIVHFDREQAIPVVDVTVLGPRSSTKARLVFDTGSQFTIIDTDLIEQIGHSAADGLVSASIQGATEDRQAGYLIKLKELHLFDIHFKDVTVGAFDFDHVSRLNVEA